MTDAQLNAARTNIQAIKRDLAGRADVTIVLNDMLQMLIAMGGGSAAQEMANGELTIETRSGILTITAELDGYNIAGTDCGLDWQDGPRPARNVVSIGLIDLPDSTDRLTDITDAVLFASIPYEPAPGDVRDGHAYVRDFITNWIPAHQ